MYKSILLAAFFMLFYGLAFSQTVKQFPKVKMGTSSVGNGDVSLQLVGRIQSYNAVTRNARDVYDRSINSPKSVLILEKSLNDSTVKKLYVNNLEGGTTTVYNMNNNFVKIAEIKHSFSGRDTSLFKETNFPGYAFQTHKVRPNVFTGKPVEMCLSNHNKYLWIPYYRRDYDKLATEPSAIAIVDVDSDKIVRVMPTAPLPKMVACSADDKYIAITNWGDNTVHLVDISSGDPMKFHYVAHFVVDYRLNLNFTKGALINRDQDCGLCLRGTVFTPDSNYLFVGRMGGGGIAVFNTQSKKYLGTVYGTKNNVRHLVINGDYLFLSSNKDGMVEKTKWKEILDYFLAGQGKKNSAYHNWQTAFTGLGARTITVTADGAYLFANANMESKISIVRTADMKNIGSINADPYPVGMVIDQSDKYLIVTAQGRKDKGGNSVMIYQITRRL
ncbi:hypothetical protein BDD43_0417 [Mucilaginibacter gracilis]|uniref:Peptidoglycan-binding protein n=1 Tax=Mucilaginibacter gracilis TaxID=423350 RepID=A0A495IUF6_9SPHI|nr:peptidoglycan-binding protein [Mucilaginibacter gracilis]RKR80320.1 hypothetical protein BDD43_0417 [Mucilaginibacter gracilis]